MPFAAGRRRTTHTATVVVDPGLTLAECYCALRRRPQADYYAATVAVDVLSFLYVAVNYQVTQFAAGPAHAQARLTARAPQVAPSHLQRNAPA